MKRIYLVLLLITVLVLGSLAFAPLHIMFQEAPPAVAQETQAVVLAAVASAIVWLVNVVLKNQGGGQSKRPSAQGKELGRGPSTLLLFVPAIILAFLFQPQTLPAFPVLTFDDPGATAMAVLSWAGLLLVSLKGLIGYAVIIYNVLLKKVLDGLADKGPDLLKELLAAFSPSK